MQVKDVACRLAGEPGRAASRSLGRTVATVVMAPLAFFIGGPYDGRSRRLARTPETYFPPDPDAPRPPGTTYRRAEPAQTILVEAEEAIVYVYSEGLAGPGGADG